MCVLKEKYANMLCCMSLWMFIFRIMLIILPIVNSVSYNSTVQALKCLVIPPKVIKEKSGMWGFLPPNKVLYSFLISVIFVVVIIFCFPEKSDVEHGEVKQKSPKGKGKQKFINPVSTYNEYF